MNWKHLFVFAALATSPAWGQARVVTACGSVAPFGPVAAGGQAFPTVDVNGNLCIAGTGGGSGGGTITANSTPTSGFTAGQLMMSDGAKTQAAPIIADATPTVNVLPAYNTGYGLASFINAGYLGLGNSSVLGWSASGYSGNPPTTALGSGPAYVLSLRNYAVPTVATAFRVYNTYTDINNGEWAALDWQTTPNVLTIGTQKNGTGAARAVHIGSTYGGAIDIDATPGYMLISDTLNVTGAITAATWGYAISGSDFVSIGTQPTITGAGGTCATTTKVGGATAGTVVLSAICASTNTIAFTGMPTAPNGYACDAEDRTTRTAGPFIESASTTTGFTLTTGATSSVAGDVLQWKCLGY